MRLFEGEVRAASITASAPGARLSTQASNFSRRRRSAALDDTITVSIPNWRKHSVSRNLADSFRSTRAARAVPFLVGAGAKAVPKAFSMGLGSISECATLIVARLGVDGKTRKEQGSESKGVITRVGLVSGKLAIVCGKLAPGAV